MRRSLLAVLLLGLLNIAQADVFRPAYLELRELGDNRYDVLWKVPAQGINQRLSVYVVFPDGTENLTESQPFITEGAWLERWRIHYPGGLVGQTVRIQGKATGVTDVIARVERLDGSSQVERLEAGAPRFVVRAPAGTFEIAWAYTVLGVEHILGGIDHLLFVFALLLVVSGGKRIVITITAFTVAH
ncbi:MAG: HupE/UreJ family protein, partial [Woeseiaceae bacterium]